MRTSVSDTDLFPHQHNTTHNFFLSCRQYVLIRVFSFTYRYISGKAGRRLPKSCFTVFHLKEDASVEENSAIQDRKMKLTCLLGISNDFLVTEVITFFKWLLLTRCTRVLRAVIKKINHKIRTTGLEGISSNLPAIPFPAPHWCLSNFFLSWNSQSITNILLWLKMVFWCLAL